MNLCDIDIIALYQGFSSFQVMAPPKNLAENRPVKCKKHRAVQEEQVFPEGPGTSTRSTASSIVFRSPEHQRHYERIKGKVLVLERKVVLRGNNHSFIIEELTRKGWGLLVSFPRRVDLKLVK